jgi:pimeloyl-ACP methyl ester carboxylesterase
VGELAYDRRGSGEPLVLLHGLGLWRGIYQPVLQRMEPHRDLVAVDFPGFGESPPDEAGTALTITDHADRIERLIAELDLERPHVGGNSMGGGVALELGRRGAARSVTVISPIGFWHRPGQAWCRWALRTGHVAGRRTPERFQSLTATRLSLFVFAFGRPFQAPEHVVLETAERSQQAPGFIDALNYGLDYDFGEAGGLTEVPVTVAWGRRDVLLPWWTQARRARRLLPWASHLTLPRCGHVPFYDDPDLCARVLLEGGGGAR